MFVLDRTKVRAIALLIGCVGAMQLWPNAYAAEQKVTLTKDVEVKAPQKTKKRKAGHSVDAIAASAWRFSPVTDHVAAANVANTVKIKQTANKRSDLIKLVIATAYKQIGKPYRWAGVGPDSFDCSGFTSYVYKKAGVYLPHNSGAQRGATKSVPLDKMQPGDLIFSSGHVGLYVGKGKMVHSPRSGRTVSVDPIHSRAYGAGRPLP